MLKSNYEFSVLVNGQPVKEYFHNGRTYIEGRPNAEYKLRVKNNGYTRIVVVPTIDGLSVIDGKPAAYDSPGYIIPGYTTDTIDGWRSDDKTVNKFYFAAANDAYAKRTGKDEKNIGVIGAVIFEERESYRYMTISSGPWVWPSVTYTSGSVLTSYNLADSNPTVTNNASSMSNASSANNFFSQQVSDISQQSLGTGWGESKKSSVNWVGFDRLSQPSAVFEIFYNTSDELKKIGVDMNDSEQTYVAGPQAFPREYCQPPKR